MCLAPHVVFLYSHSPFTLQCRPYLVNLLPCLASLASRPEEAVHEALAQALPQLFRVLGSFTNDNEVKILIKAFLANVGSPSTVVRRTTATCLSTLVTSCRKPALFSSWLLTTAVGLLLPLNSQTLVTLISGVLSLCRSILPLFSSIDDEAEALLQLYELCIHFLRHQDHNIVNASLETLQQLLRSAPSLLVFLLSSPSSVGQSRLASDQHQESEEGTQEQEQPGELPSLQSVSDMAEAMSNTILSFPEERVEPAGEEEEEEEETSDTEESREEIVLPPPDPGGRQAVVEQDPGVGESSVGSFTDGGVSLYFLGRTLASSFLLTREKGDPVPDRRARVSVKTLALSCLGEVVILCPQLWSLHIYQDLQEELTSPVFSDLVLFLDHEDPGLRGATGRLVARVLRGACLESGGKLETWFQRDGQPEQVELIQQLVTLLSDESSVTVRQALGGSRLALPHLLQSTEAGATATLLRTLPPLADNKYWLVRLDLCELLAAVPSLQASYILPSWSSKVLESLTKLLGDEDARVRTAAATSLVSIVSELPMDTGSGLPHYQSQLLARTHFQGQEVSTQHHEELPRPLPLSAPAHFPLVNRVSSLLATASSRHLSAGCAELLAVLATNTPPLLHPSAWGVHAPGRARRHSSQGPAPLACPALSLLSLTTRLLTSTPSCQTLACHSHLLSLSSHLYAGLAGQALRNAPEAAKESSGLVPGDQLLSDAAEALLHHLLKLLAILHHVFEELVPAPPSSKPTLPSLPNTSMSPIKKRSSEATTPSSPTEKEKPFSPKDEKKLRGSFATSPYYMKQYEVLRSSHAVYRTSLEAGVEERLTAFSSAVLDCLSTFLEFSNGADIGKYVEEILSYVKSCLTISASASLHAVQCLLKCLFKSNFVFLPYNPGPSPFPTLTTTSSIFDNLISRPYTLMTLEHGLVVEGRGELSTGSISPIRRGATVRPPLRHSSRSTDRSSLANYIRLFEPMVIKALKQYTVTSDVERQSRVLQLLTQLVRLRVNYCLLDSDQIFIGFVLKQLEAIEEGQLNNAELLIPHIFEFLVLLSYEKNHSKVIIDVPKILQLCEGLAARSEASAEHVVPALQVVAADLFTTRTGAELEAQREVVVSMMLKQLGRRPVMESIVQLLDWVRAEEGGDDKARKLSRQVVDALLPLLCSHQVQMRERGHLDSLKCLLKALSPGTLRPCDPLLSALLGCSVDLALLPEVLSWLGFTVASFLTIFQLSPEEAVLGRLQELGIMLGSTGSSLLEASMQSSTSTTGEQGAPEHTLATFLLHVVGSAASKLHQMLFSPSSKDREGQLFLQQELSDLLLLLTYILQSGRCPRLARAMVALARNSPQGAMHSTDMVTDLVLQMGHASPVLTVQWLYLLVLLERSAPSVWASVLGIGRGPANSRLSGAEQSEPAASLGLEVSRRAAVAVLSNHLVENTGDGELLAWLLSSQIKEIIHNVSEPQVKEFITVVHRQSPASGVLLEAISARLETMRSAENHSAILDCLTNIHKAHTGRVLQLLVHKLLQHPVLALGRRASSLACRRVELLLTEIDTVVHEQLSQPELASLLEVFARKTVAKRHAKLVALLNRLAVSFYDLSPLELSDGRKFNPGSVSGVELDKSWYLAQVKRSCCTNSPPQECARLLANINFSDIMLIMTAKDFNLRVLEECLLQGITLPDCYAPSMDSLDRLPGLLSDPDRSPGLREAGVSLKEGPPLYRAASQVLLQHIKNVVELLPRPTQIYRPQAWWTPTHAETKYTHRLDDLFNRSEGRNLVTQLLPSFARLLTTYPRLPGRRPVLPPHAVLEMARLGVLAMELLKWLVAGCREELPGREHITTLCLHVAGLTLANPHIGAALALPSSSTLAASAVISLTDFLLFRLPLPLPALPFPSLTEALEQPAPPPLLVAGSCLARLLLLLELLGTNPVPYCLAEATPAIVCLARLPQFSALCRAPPLAFTLGWSPSLELEAGMAVPEDLLQEVEVLRQLVWRLNTLGWTSRAQFEETWVCLLSVLNVARDDLSNEEVSALSQSTTLVVAAISSLLVNTLALPVAGIPGARLLHHPRDSPHHCLLSGRGQQLTAIQNIIHQRLEDLGASPGLPVDSSVNLERSTCQVSTTWASYSPVPVAGYGAAQVSVNYLQTCLLYHEEGGDDRQSIASSALPLFLLLREENLAAAGLDTHSCTQFLTDLFSQWLAHGGQDTPLTVLTASVRAMIMISDIFTQDSQWSWMLGALSDLYKVHPAEDELMTGLLLLGISKAVAVIGFREPDLWERLKRGLEGALRSAHLPGRVAALHSLLYLLQRGEGPETQGLLSLALDHLRTHLLRGGGRGGEEDREHQLVQWSLLFYTLENYEQELGDPDLGPSLVQLTLATAGQCSDLSRPLYTTLLTGLERLVVAGSVRGRALEQVSWKAKAYDAPSVLLVPWMLL